FVPTSNQDSRSSLATVRQANAVTLNTSGTSQASTEFAEASGAQKAHTQSPISRATMASRSTAEVRQDDVVHSETSKKSSSTEAFTEAMPGVRNTQSESQMPRTVKTTHNTATVHQDNAATLNTSGTSEASTEVAEVSGAQKAHTQSHISRATMASRNTVAVRQNDVANSENFEESSSPEISTEVVTGVRNTHIESLMSRALKTIHNTATVLQSFGTTLKTFQKSGVSQASTEAAEARGAQNAHTQSHISRATMAGRSTVLASEKSKNDGTPDASSTSDMRTAYTQYHISRTTLVSHSTVSGMHDMKRYRVSLTLDPRTASPHLVLSTNLKNIRYISSLKNRTKNWKRFDRNFCVLASQGFTSG
ncbi:hypothetical protein NDU88_007055, partial [Pleurodeles waltl]